MSEVQMAPNLTARLRIFLLDAGARATDISRNCTLNFEFGSFPGTICSFVLSCVAEQRQRAAAPRQPPDHEDKLSICSKLFCPATTFWFSLSVQNSIDYMRQQHFIRK